MSQAMLSGIVLIVLMLIFLGIVAWAWSKKRRRDFEAAARLPLEEDRRPSSVRERDKS